MMGKRVLVGLCLLTFLLLISCMGEDAGLINYHRVGVVRETPIQCIYTSDDEGNIYVVSSSDFENRTDLEDGDCCSVDFKTSFTDMLADGVYDADIFSYDTVPVCPLYDELTDTSVIVTNERLVTLYFDKSIYLEGRFFLETKHKNHQEDQTDIMNLSYDPEEGAEEDEDGERVYNLYLRVAQEGGTGDSTTYIRTTAFTIADFLDQAKEIEDLAGLDRINFRIKYPTGFNADTTACVWGSTDMFTLLFTD